MSTKHPRRDERPIVTIQKARCPKCRTIKLRTVASTAAEDGSSTRDMRCLDPDCGLWFFVVAE